MSFNFVNHAEFRSLISNPTIADVTGVDMTGATHLVLQIAMTDGIGDPTVTSTPSNTWIKDREETGLASGIIKTYRASAATTTNSMDFHLSAGASAFFGAVVQGFNGETTFPLDQTNVNNATGVTSIQTNSVTPTEGNELVTTGLILTGTSTPSIDSGFVAHVRPGVVGESYGCGAAYIIQTSASATNPTWSFSSDSPATTIVTYKAVNPPTANLMGQVLT